MTQADFALSVERDEDIIDARSRSREMAKAIGFGVVDQARITTAVSELARNILVHAGKGVIRVRVVEVGKRRGLEVVAEDKGPGIENIDLALSEGYSSVGGLGLGLPGAKRLMDEMDVHSAPGKGTTVIAHKWMD